MTTYQEVIHKPDAPHHEDHIHPPPSNWFTHYVFSQDHKMIAKQFLFTALGFFVLGGVLALLMRWQLAWPGSVIPILGSHVQGFKDAGGIMPPEAYAYIFSQHGTIMIFFVIIPMLVGVFGNFLIPLQIGCRDMAFPLLNALSYWCIVPGAVIMMASFFIDGGPGAAGWTGYPPISRINGLGLAGFMGTGLTGQDFWIISLLFVGFSSLMGAINYITTILNMRAPGMTMHRMPLAVWTLLVTSVLTLMAIPSVTGALVMLLLDRHAGTSFFLPANEVISGEHLPNTGGGQVLLWQHLFWFYSHPAVYIMILPGMGMVSDILPVFARKPVFGYRAIAYSSIGIASLGFVVWGHHMFQSGMNPKLGTTFMIGTMFIAVPSAIKTFNWLGTLWGGSIRFTVPMLNAIAFVAMFAIGGLSGIFMASTPVDIFIHDTYFIVAHIHYVLFGGSVFAIFAGITYWYPKMFGKMMNEPLGKVHFWLTLIAYNCTFFPMHIVGAGGMMRRIYDPTQYAHLRHLQPLNVFMTEAALILGIAQVCFALNFFFSLFRFNNVIGRVLAIVAGAFGALAYAPLIDMVVAGLGIHAGHATILGIQFEAAGIAIPLGLVAAAWTAWYLVRSKLSFGAASGDNPWQANTLEWQIPSPAPYYNYEKIPLVYHGPYEYSSPHDVNSDYLPQNSPMDAAPRLAEIGDAVGP